MCSGVEWSPPNRGQPLYNVLYSNPRMSPHLIAGNDAGEHVSGQLQEAPPLENGPGVTDDVGIALVCNLLEGELEGVVATALHQGGGPHQRLADGLQGEVGDDMPGEVGLEEREPKLGAHLQQAEGGLVVSRHLQTCMRGRESEELCKIKHNQ